MSAAIHPKATQDPNDAANRIRAYLTSMRPLPGEMRPDIEKQYYQGMGLIAQLSLSVGDDDMPSLRLSPSQCADVLTFMHHSNPIDLERGWTDENRVSHVCGWSIVLASMADGLRARRRS
jgi:hypothetical protein